VRGLVISAPQTAGAAIRRGRFVKCQLPPAYEGSLIES